MQNPFDNFPEDNGSGFGSNAELWPLYEAIEMVGGAFARNSGNFDLDDYLADLVEALVDSTDAAGALLWRPNDEDGFSLDGGVNIVVTDSDRSEEVVNEQIGYVEEVFGDSQPVVVSPIVQEYALDEYGQQAGVNLSLTSMLRSHTRLLVPVVLQSETVAVCEVFCDSPVGESVAWQLAATTAVAQKIQMDLSRVGHVALLRTTEQKSQQLSVANVVTRHLGEKEHAYDVVNEMHALLGEGRVSLATIRGTKATVKAVSGQPVFDKRSSTIKSVERLAILVSKSGQPLYHPEHSAALAPQLRKALDHYYDAADAKSIALIPLVSKQEPSSDPNDLAAVVRDRENKVGKCVGVIVIEGLRNTLAQENIAKKWDPISTIVTNSVVNTSRYNGFFLMPVWQKLGLIADVFRGHHRNKALLALGAFALAAGALLFMPSDFKLRAGGVIQPTERSQVYAEVTGVVKDILVENGQWVEKGQLLMELDNPELQAQLADVHGELHAAQRQYDTLMLQRANREFRSSEDLRRGIRDAAGLKARIDGLVKQVSLMEEQKEQLMIRSPAAGQVVSWDTQRRLSGRPVQPGERLLTVANSKGPWELEIRMPDKRSGYLLHTWNESQEKSMKTTYVLASDPRTVRHGLVRNVALSANVHEEDGNVVRVYVDLAQSPVDESAARPGTSVVAQVHVGRRSLGYCKFYEFIDFMQRMHFVHN